MSRWKFTACGATQRFDGNRFDTTVLGVSALASPDVQVALETTAVD